MTEVPHADRRRIAKTVAASTTGATRDLPKSVLMFMNGEKPTAAETQQPPNNLVELGMFNTALCETPFAKVYVDKKDITWLTKIGNKAAFSEDEENKKKRYFTSRPNAKEEVYDLRRERETERRKTSTKVRVNKAIFNNLQEEFELNNEDEALAFFHRHWQGAIAATQRHIDVVHKGQIKLPSELLMKHSPADLIAMLVAEDTAPELRKQIQTTLLLSRISAELEASTKGADEKLAQLQLLFNEKLYEGKIGETTEVTKYALYSKKNNELIADPTDIEPTSLHEDVQRKKITANTRKVQIGKNGDSKTVPVVQIINTKDPSTGIEKALRKARKEQTKTGRETVSTNEYVGDTHRMMFVVLGDMQDTEDVRGKLVDVIADNFDVFEKGKPEDVHIEDEAKIDEEGKSDKYNRLRIKLQFKGIEKKIEIILQTLPDYLRANYDVGTYDEEKGTYTGQAHALFEITRAQNLSNIFLPNFNGTVETKALLDQTAKQLCDAEEITI